MNIKDFLIDNYIWIIVIILITIITIIGFLADKKKGDKKKEGGSTFDSNPNNMTMPQQPIQYQQSTLQNNNQMNNNVGMGFNGPLSQMQNGFGQNMGTLNTQPVVTEPTPIPVNAIPTNNVTQINNPMPVENVIPQVEQESMYQPLSEQKPMIAPQPITSFGENVNNNQQPMINNSPQNIQNMVHNQVTPMNTIINNNQQQFVTPEPMMNQTENYNISNNTPQMGFDNAQMLSNVNQMTTIPQPVNPAVISTPQPVQPQPIITNTYNNSQMMGGPNYNQPTTQSHIETTVNQTSQPINFVYGPQNNNPNM